MAQAPLAYVFDQQAFALDVTRSDRSWGVALSAVIVDDHGQEWARCNFLTHPTFPEFDEFQLMDTPALAAKALQILVNGGHQSIAETRATGLVIGFRMNSAHA